MPLIPTLALCACVLVAALAAIETLDAVVLPRRGRAARHQNGQHWALVTMEGLSAKLLQSLAYLGVLGVLPSLMELPKDWFASGLPAQGIAGTGLVIALLHRRPVDGPARPWTTPSQR